MNRIKRAALALGVPENLIDRTLAAKIAVGIFTAGQLLYPLSEAQAATLSSAKVALSDPRPSQTNVTYLVTVSSVSAQNIRCVKADFSSAPGTSTAIGNSFSASGASVNAANSSLINSSATGWTATPATNSITYTNSTGVTPSTTSAATFQIDGVNNSSVADTGYWLRFNTYNNTDCSSNPVDNATIGFIYTNGSTLSLTVDQTLTFTVNGLNINTPCNGAGNTTGQSTATTIPFGTVTPSVNGLVCQDLTASTNATHGYTIYARYTGAPSNGLGQPIQDVSGTNDAPGSFPAAGTTEAYGYSTDDSSLTATGNGTDRFTSPSQGWAKMTSNNAEVGYEAVGVNSTTYRIAHQVAVTTLTKPGTYTTTVIYTCTPVF